MYFRKTWTKFQLYYEFDKTCKSNLAGFASNRIHTHNEICARAHTRSSRLLMKEMLRNVGNVLCPHATQDDVYFIVYQKIFQNS